MLLAAAPAPDDEDKVASIPTGFYRLQTAVKLPGARPDWDYLAYDGARHHLFIARRAAGLWVYDTLSKRLIAKIPNTAGAGATTIIPELNRGFSANEDGSTTVFNLATLAPIKRLKFANDADAGSYDDVTGNIAFVSADSQKVTLVDPKTLQVGAQIAVPAKKADASAADGAGGLLLNERDRNMVLRIDLATAKISAEWPTTGCAQPTGMAIDPVHHRAFIGCRSNAPVLDVMNTETGQIVATLPIGRGNDGVVYDAKRARVITTNGIDGNIVIYHQDDADHYRLEQAITTRPNARTMAYDASTGRIFSVTAEGVVNPAEKVNTGPSAFYPNAYYDNSFVVLTYAANKH
jgi:hypothetical protein